MKNNIAHSVDTCGFCGKATCNVNLVNSSKKKKEKKFKAESHCDYAVNLNLASAANVIEGIPCCNRFANFKVAKELFGVTI